MSFNDQGRWDGSFYLGQWAPVLTAMWLITYAPQYAISKGLDVSIFQDGTYTANTGQVDGTTEQQQLQVAAALSRIFTSDPADLAAFRATLDPNDPAQLGWTDAQNDIDHAVQELGNGSGIDDFFNAFVHGGYTETAAADAICRAFAPPIRDIAGIVPEIRLPSGFGSSRILAMILQAPFEAFSIMDPVLFVDQTTGQLSQTETQWAYHEGCEHVNVVVPFTTWQEYIAAYSFINFCALVRFDSQGGAILAGPGVIGGVPQVMLSRQPYATALGADMAKYAATYGLTMNDLVSPVPVTPGQKQRLRQSRYFNEQGLCPPTYMGSFIKEILAGVAPICRTGDPAFPHQVAVKDSHGVVSQLAINLDFNEIVCQDYSKGMTDWLAADNGRLYPPPLDRTLRLIAGAYPPPSGN